MKTVTIPTNGPPEILEVRESPDPVPASGEVVIAVKAAGINFADILARQGLYPDAPGFPAVVGYEVAGEVISVAAGVSDFREGDRVTALTRFGGYAEKVAVPADQVFRTPGLLSDIEAAAIPVTYLTAMQLTEMGGLMADDTLLIHNAGGGVGLAAIDLAKQRGARILGTASGWKHEQLYRRGVDVCIDYRSGDWYEKVKDATNGKGVEVIFDPLGGKNWKQSYRALRPTGRLGMFGVSEVTVSGLPGGLKFVSLLKSMPLYAPVQLMNANKGVFGVNIGKLWHERRKLSAWAQKILQGAEEGWLKPKISAVFSFDEAWAAHRYIENRSNFGKVILIPEKSE